MIPGIRSVRIVTDMKLAAVILFAVVATGLIVARAAGWAPFSWLETVGVVTGAGCVLLVVLRSVWNFPVGMVSCAAYLAFFYENKLYADAGLQIVFIVLAVHGWMAWTLGKADVSPIKRIRLDEVTALAVLFPSVWLGLTRLLEHVGGANPPLDAFVTALSLVSQWLLNRRYVESWLGWIVVDQVAVFLFWSREMYLTAGLYAVFLAMCVAGLVEWRHHLAEKPS